MEIQQIMVAKYLQVPGLVLQGNKCYAVFDPMLRHAIGYFAQVVGMLFDELFEHRICLIINKYSSRFDLIDKDAELFKIIVEGREDIDMIPGDAGDDGYVREQEVEFGASFERTCRVFVAFTDDERSPGDINRLR